jgi:hypothetical protein
MHMHLHVTAQLEWSRTICTWHPVSWQADVSSCVSVEHSHLDLGMVCISHAEQH